MTEEKLNTLKIELPAATLSLRWDEIVHIHLKEVEEFSADDLRGIVNCLKEISNGKKSLNLITFESFFIVDKETRKLAATNDIGKYSIAEAIVTKSIAIRLLVNFGYFSE